MVAASLPDRGAGRRKSRVGECAHGDRDQVRKPFRLPINGRAANPTEPESHRTATVRRADEARGSPCDVADLVGMEPCLVAKHASRPPLTLEAVAHRNPDGFALADKVQSSAATGSTTRRHFLLNSRRGPERIQTQTPEHFTPGSGAAQVCEPAFACIFGNVFENCRDGFQSRLHGTRYPFGCALKIPTPCIVRHCRTGV
jgi:hypothetical protein